MYQSEEQSIHFYKTWMENICYSAGFHDSLSYQILTFPNLSEQFYTTEFVISYKTLTIYEQQKDF